RAELPSGGAAPEFEVRRAEVATSDAAEPIPEVRRALLPQPDATPEEIRKAPRALALQEVPKAKPARKKRR
ncbi:MAG: hypothetical protein JNG86_16715, partial [Verrucomicrobiaceae bacterium]|nr:hypothetical protein [Verrucomicrobiaceae bacterium]